LALHHLRLNAEVGEDSSPNYALNNRGFHGVPNDSRGTSLADLCPDIRSRL
jgi:hypothetical protein